VYFGSGGLEDLRRLQILHTRFARLILGVAVAGNIVLWLALALATPMAGEKPRSNPRADVVSPDHHGRVLWTGADHAPES